MNCHDLNTQTHAENQANTDPDTQTDRQTDRQKHTLSLSLTHTHTHTWEAGVRHVGHILVVLIMRETQVLHTHRCPHGVNKCDCMLAHH
jgi:hypothetical protein